MDQGLDWGQGAGPPKQFRRALSPQDSRVRGEPSPESTLLPSPLYWLPLSPQQCRASVPVCSELLRAGSHEPHGI